MLKTLSCIYWRKSASVAPGMGRRGAAMRLDSGSVCESFLVTNPSASTSKRASIVKCVSIV